MNSTYIQRCYMACRLKNVKMWIRIIVNIQLSYKCVYYTVLKLCSRYSKRRVSEFQNITSKRLERVDFLRVLMEWKTDTWTLRKPSIEFSWCTVTLIVFLTWNTIQIHPVRKTLGFETSAALCSKELINFFSEFHPHPPHPFPSLRSASAKSKAVGKRDSWQ